MAFAIFRSPMSFFETTPSGRILNRFSRFETVEYLHIGTANANIAHSDIYRVDEVLARTFNMVS
jgi:ATP-binding cassette subfamily C (CFTR/MRP) protein 1